MVYPSPGEYTYEDVDKMIKKGKKIVIFQNQVIDVEHWINEHIGGAEVLKEVIGKEISRYFIGGFIAKGKTKPHFHTHEAFQKIQDFTIGTISTTVNLFYDIKNKVIDTDSLEWTLIKKVPITKVHNRYHFACQGVKVKAILPGVENAGKYFTLTNVSTQEKRNYGLFFTATDKLLSKYQKLLKAVINNDDSWTAEDQIPDINEFYRNELEIFIKTKEQFSKHINQIPLEGEPNYDVSKCKFHVSGPFGKGLQLSKCPQGPIVAIICGTSVAMWLEIVAYMIRKAAYEIGVANKKNFKMFKNEKFNDLTDPNFKLILFSSFNREDETIGKPIFEAMEMISKKQNLNNFEYHLRLSEKMEPHYTAQYLSENIKTLSPLRVYFWGPKESKDEVSDVLKEMKIKEEILYDV